ncbi:hypothetical protein Tco_1531314 [Tanacetum coccineum]
MMPPPEHSSRHTSTKPGSKEEAIDKSAKIDGLNKPEFVDKIAEEIAKSACVTDDIIIKSRGQPPGHSDNPVIQDAVVLKSDDDGILNCCRVFVSYGSTIGAFNDMCNTTLGFWRHKSACTVELVARGTDSASVLCSFELMECGGWVWGMDAGLHFLTPELRVGLHIGNRDAIANVMMINFLFSTRGLSSPVSWLGSHTRLLLLPRTQIPDDVDISCCSPERWATTPVADNDISLESETKEDNHRSTKVHSRGPPPEAADAMQKAEDVTKSQNEEISFDYRVPLSFGSIAGDLDHVNPVIRLPIEHRISRCTRVGIMKMEPDIENMTLNEYLEYEDEKERRLWDNLR